MKKTITVRICIIPTLLQAGEFYRGLLADQDCDGNSNECIEIPFGCLVHEIHENNLETMCQLLKASLFWVLDEIPFSILEFCLRNEVAVWCEPFSSVPGAKESQILEALISVYSDKSQHSFEAIMKTDRWEMIRHGVLWKSKDSRATAEAARSGNLKALKLLHEAGFVWCYDCCSGASSFGHLECLRYMHENGCPVNYLASIAAASCGHLDCFKYIHQQGVPLSTECTAAAACGQLACLQYAHQNGGAWDSALIYQAGKGGHLECIIYAREQGLEWNADTCAVAATHGRLNCLQYAHENGCAWDSFVVLEAAKNGHIDCLRYAHQQGLPWHEYTCTAAAVGEHAGCRECLLYALQHGCPMSDESCDAVCGKGSLESLTLMHQYGARWTVFTTVCAAAAPNVSCLQYLHTHGCPWDRYTLYNAARFARIDNLRYACEHGCPYDEWLVTYAIGKGAERLACLQYLVEEQLLPIDESIFFCALLGGFQSPLRYLLDQGCPFIGAVFPVEKEEYYRKLLHGTYCGEVSCAMDVLFEYGWVPDAHLIGFLSAADKYDSYGCVKYLTQKGFIEAKAVAPISNLWGQGW